MRSILGGHSQERCWICGRTAGKRTVTLRGGGQRALRNCSRCRFCFFDFDNTENLKQNRLDQTRLVQAGLAVPPVRTDFKNGIQQSLGYVRRFLGAGDKSKNILEVGCSWGYFLQASRKAGVRPFGVEINLLRARYVKTRLKIPCYPSLEEIEKEGIRFQKIFLFYSLEYIAMPKEFLNRLWSLLDKGGKIIIITPNLDDVLKDVWRNQGFRDFFYDKTAIAHYSTRALSKLLAPFKKTGLVKVSTEQGYSFVNHLSWYLTNKPKTTHVVGGDRYVEDIASLLSSSQNRLGALLSGLIRAFDRQYRRCIETAHYGNRLIAVITKSVAPI